MPEPNNAEIGFEKEIWKAADLLRGNLDASEEKYNTLVAEGEGFEEDLDVTCPKASFSCRKKLTGNPLPKKLTHPRLSNA